MRKRMARIVRRRPKSRHPLHLAASPAALLFAGSPAASAASASDPALAGDGFWLALACAGLACAALVILLQRRRLRRMKAKLDGNRKWLRAIFDHAPAAILLKDREGRYLEINKSCEALFGFTNAECVGLTPEDINPGPGDEDARAHDLEVLETGVATTRRVRLETSQGPRSLQSVKFPIFSRTGAVDGVGAVIVDVTESAAALERAESAELRLREAVEALPGGFVAFDRERKMIFCNEAYRNLTALPRERITPGVSYREILLAARESGYAPDGEADLENWVETRIDGAPEGVDSEFRTPDGRWFKANDRVTSDGGLVGIRIEITELRRQRDALAAARMRIEDVAADLRIKSDRLQQIIRLSAIGGWEVDAQTKAVWWDPLTRRIHEADAGFSPDFRSAIKFFTPESRERVASAVAGCLNDATPFDVEAELITARDRRAWVRILGEADREGGEIVRLQGVIQDISEQKRHEAALQAANDELRAAIAGRASAERRFFDIAAVSTDWFWEQDRDLRFTFISDSYTRTTGGDPETHIGRTREELLQSDRAAREGADWDWLAQKIAARAPFSDFVYRAFGDTDGPRWVRISGAPFHDESGAFAGYRGVGSDVTTLYDALRRAKAASEAKSAFLATMSHEIRTPMNGVLGVAEELGRRVTEPAERRLVATIRESGETLLNVINDILDFSKIEAGKLDLETTDFSPALIARRAAALHEMKTREKGLDFTLVVEPAAERTRRGDPHRVSQILHNLVGNAVKFTETGEVTVTFGGEPGGPLTIAVRDTGVGMNQAEIARVFEGFRQADSSTTRRFGGTGLGMSIVKSLVEAMAGEITIDSTPGAGAEIRVSLPLPIVDTRSEPAAPAAVAALPEGLKILAADDNATNRMVIELLLKRVGAASTVVESGRDAVAAANDERDRMVNGDAGFDLILMDISMPDMDGIEALAAIRDQEAKAGAPRVPAIAITANALTHQVADYLASGFDGHVAKPIQGDALFAEIDACLDRARLGGRERDA
ncbi:PAS domain-containing protein [Pikeienuella piscinae]|uniref:histidine kinase n=1 Tax=Pikeienuella piscinae TaxID=2748098 RepID=A0A7M3T576_9RHOB|nr:PAS domain-containing protein [Pikeienuella piscinae]QIE57157.1 PAS domain-containing protein [Pikeienuella piscinae]